MPLIYIELASNLDGISPIVDTPPITKMANAVKVSERLARELPKMVMHRLDTLHLDLKTSEGGVRVSVRQRAIDEYVVNGEDLWFRICLSERMDTEKVRIDQKQAFKTMIADWFTENGLLLPSSTVFEFIPGPTYGCGAVKGESLDW
ncbi:MAG: hypothetical protein KDA17_00875 [Candidatus Saccharibacteria bacterium]|nr:hypothetical protein [Candidatus Saccharibacteria bacterium]